MIEQIIVEFNLKSLRNYLEQFVLEDPMEARNNPAEYCLSFKPKLEAIANWCRKLAHEKYSGAAKPNFSY